MTQMSLTQEVVAVIEDRERVTLSDLAPLFPKFSRQQIRVAVYNAAFRGLVVRVQRGRGQGKGKGSEPSVFGPAAYADAPAVETAPSIGRVSSVWDLGARA